MILKMKKSIVIKNANKGSVVGVWGREVEKQLGDE